MKDWYWMLMMVFKAVRISRSEEYARCSVKLDLNACNNSNSLITEDCNSAPVCRKHFNIVYMDYKPFSPEILNDTLRICCGDCISSTMVTIANIADITKDLMSKSHFVFPVLGKAGAGRLYGYKFLPLIEAPNVYYITKKENNLMLSLILSCLNMWPLLLVCAFMIIISGFLCWIAEMKKNEDEFPRSFASGWFEGIWWSFISITTVGYGDKAPKSVSGRILAILWIVVGITAFSLITATLTSEIVAANSVPPPQISHAKVGLIRHHKYEGMLIAKQGGVLVGIDPANLTEGIHQLIEMVERKKINGFVLDRYELMLFYKFFYNNRFYQHDVVYLKEKTIITEIIERENYAYGILVKHEEDYQFLADFLLSNNEVINTCNRLFLSNYSQQTIHIDRKVTLFSSNGEMFWPSFVACGIVILICMGTGSLYELTRKGYLSKTSCRKTSTASNKQLNL